MYVTPQKGRQRPSIYLHKYGLVYKKRGAALRFMLLIAFVVGGSVTMALTQYSKQLEAFIRSQPIETASIQAPDKIIPLARPIEGGVVGIEAAVFDDQLQQIIQTWASTHHEQDWSIVVQGLDGTKQYASVRAASWYVPANISQLYTAYSVLKHNNLDQIKSISVRVNGHDRTVADCLEAMLHYSDNSCADALMTRMSLWRIESDARQAGLNNTYINRKDAMFTSAEDASLMMAKLYDKSLLNEKENDYLLTSLQKQTQRNGIPKGCEGCSVANKTGDSSNVRHDTAIVKYGNKTYVLSIFTTGAKYSEIAELTSQVNRYMSK